MDFGLVVLTGMLVNALPAIKKKLEDIFTAVGKFITPVVDTIQILINAVSGPDGKVSPELEEKQIKFRQDIETAKDNLLEGIRTKLGPLGGLVDALKPLIDNLTSKFGAKLKLQTGGATLTINEAGQEGITTSEGNFVRSDFSPDQRRRYDKGDRKAYIIPAEIRQNYTEKDAAASAAASEIARGSSTIIDQKNLPKLPPTGHIAGQKYGAPRDDDGDGISDRKHAGTDFDAGPNDTFYSRIGGVVMRQYETSRGYGKYVDIYNKDLNVTERIAEGDITLVNTGDKITPGTPVQRGTAQTGVFHYEIRNGKEETYGFEGTRDPVKFLNDLAKKANISSSTTPTSANITPTGNQTITADVIGQSSDDEEGLLVVVQPIVYTTA
jgi:murein DD-endopeptidase MepM/ murein hydrolase activator NlpD